jgi:hypothetical protein
LPLFEGLQDLAALRKNKINRLKSMRYVVIFVVRLAFSEPAFFIQKANFLRRERREKLSF